MKRPPTRFYQDLARDFGVDYDELKRLRKENRKLSLTQAIDLLRQPAKNDKDPGSKAG